ncbi:hypothetical protein L218DRAFT_952107 [Marasmius fiardii PR-910]|nr:hypothetical protein L218DRAFT_952107 [Marasmius fiardii PR-910]
MQGRIGVERRQCEGRSSDLPAEVAGTWDSLAHELRELRLLSSDSPFLQKWRDLLDTLLTTEGPNVSELFELRPFSKMRHLKNALLPVFTMNGTTKIQTEMYHKMLASLRPTLQILHNSHHSPDLFDRVDIYGPSSAHFSPPHMSIRNSTKDDLSKVLAKQAHLIRTMQFRSISLLPLLDQLKTLDSHPQPLVALTTLNFRDVLEETFSDQVVKSITSILRKNHTIVCLGFDDCCYIDDAVLDRFQEAIQSNRKEWVQRAVAAGHDEVIYHAGIQMSSGKEHNTLHLTGDGAFSIFQEDVFLTPGGEIYVLVYIPSSGKIVPSMWLMLDDVDYVTAKLQRLTGKVEDGIFGAEESVSALLSSRLDLRGIPRVERVGRCL